MERPAHQARRGRAPGQHKERRYTTTPQQRVYICPQTCAYFAGEDGCVNPNTDPGKAGKPTVATPAIPLGWPTGVGVSEDHVYVNDTYNRRAVRVDKTYAAEAVCEIK